MRWFTPWTKARHVDDYPLPQIITNITGQKYAPFGDAIIETLDTVIGVESCEELFTPNRYPLSLLDHKSPHIQMSLDGVEIFTNSSASHHEFQKLDKRIHLIQSASSKCGGVYLYANQQGCDGDRAYYDGSSSIALNGEILVQGTPTLPIFVDPGSQFSLKDVEVITANINLQQIRSYKSAMVSRCMQAASTSSFPRIRVSAHLSTPFINFSGKLTKSIKVRYLSPEEEICYGPACWLWDYATRSKSSGFLLPLSGGIDSCSTALIVYSMCLLVVKAVGEGDDVVLQGCRSVVGDPEYTATDAKELSGYAFNTSIA